MRPFNRFFGRFAAGLLGTGLATTAVGQTPITPGPPSAAKTGPGERAPATKKSLPEPAPETILQPGEVPIDLGSALRLAGVENPELLLARQRVTEITALRQLAAAQILPNLNLGTNFDYHLGALQQASGNILNVNRDALYLGLGANAVGAGTVNIPGLSYNLNVGAAWYGFLVARQRVTTSQAAVSATNNDVLLRVCLGYLELLRGDGRRAVATRNRVEAADLARITRSFAETGQGRQADADRADVELRRRDAELLQAEADTLTASARLCQLLNLNPSNRLKPIDGWVVPAPIVPDPIPLSELLVVALLRRPELAGRRSEVQQALYEMSLAKILPFSPNVILGFSAGGFGGGSNLISTPPGFISASGQTIVGPRFSDLDSRTDLDVAVFWTLRNMGVGNIALIRAADSRLKQSRLRELETMNLVRSQVAEAHARVSARFLQINATEKATLSSTRAFKGDLDRIQGGQGLPLEAVDSLRLLGRSRFEYLDAIIDYNRAQFELYVALGNPPANCLARPVPPNLVPPPTSAPQRDPGLLPAPLPLPVLPVAKP